MIFIFSPKLPSFIMLSNLYKYMLPLKLLILKSNIHFQASLTLNIFFSVVVTSMIFVGYILALHRYIIYLHFVWCR